MERSADTLADLGEFGLIERIAAMQSEGSHVLLGIGDDAAVVEAPDSRVVLTTDVLVEGVHFRGDWSGAHDIGRRAAAASLSDIAAMGATATALVVAFAGPAQMSAQWALDLAEGIAAESERVGASVVGGDVSQAKLPVITVAAIGDLAGRAPVTRSGARPGDLVALAGRQGWAAAGLTVLSRGFRSPRVLVEAYRRPQPPYESGPAAAGAGATSMCDVSDGLLADASHIAKSSGVLIDIRPHRVPVPETLSETAAAFNVDPMTWVLSGGDDHCLLATFPPDVEIPETFEVLGKVLPPSPECHVSVDGRPWVGEQGHEHFT